MQQIENDVLIFKSLPRMYQKKLEGENYAVRSLKKEEVEEIQKVLNATGYLKIKIINSVTGDYVIYDLLDIKFEPVGYAPKIVEGGTVKQEYYSGVFTW